VPSYHYMEEVISQWDAMGILKEVLLHKLIFIETKDVVETTLALDSFKKVHHYPLHHDSCMKV